MNKETYERSRLIIGVREWAVETIFRLGMGIDRWLRPDKMRDTKIVLEEAAKLEGYVMEDITEPMMKGQTD